MTTICAFCLSSDRNLAIIDEKYWKIVDSYITSEDDELQHHLQCLQRKQTLQICWECSTRLKSWYQFICMSQQCLRVCYTYLEGSTQTLPDTTSKLYRTRTEIIYTGPKNEDTETEDMVDTIDSGLIYDDTKIEDVTDIKTEDMADTIDSGSMYEEIATEEATDNIYTWPINEELTDDVTVTLDVKMENDPLETEFNNIPDKYNGEDINSDIREGPCTSVDLEMIKKQVPSWRVIPHGLPIDTLPANIMPLNAPVTICDGTNNTWVKAMDVPRVETVHEVTDCISKQHKKTDENEEDIPKKDKVITIPKSVFKIPKQKPRVSLSYICDHCQQNFNTKINLERHISFHYGVSDVNLTCQTCNYKGDTVQALQKHSGLHDEKRLFKCNICTYRFSSNYSYSLMTHGRTHTGEKPYKCDMCDYATSTNSLLILHMRTHTGEKPYICDKCDFRSTQSGNLKTHENTHGRDAI